jgi:nucleoside-diphosphate-sugar epimerase
MRILITGSSGQLGAEIARQLSAQHDIIGIDRVEGVWTHHRVNIVDREAVRRLMEGIDAVIHIASLHAPDLATESAQAFIDVNITGTLNLLEAAKEKRVRRFVYTSTTSLYGLALIPDAQAVWVTEELTPQPRDIYDITKRAAEDLCQHFAGEYGLSTICLRTARFFPEAVPLMAFYRFYRGVDVRDVARAHVLAVTYQEILFDVFNISAQSPFKQSDLPALLHDAPAVLRSKVPEALSFFTQQGWALPKSIDRVHVIERARRQLGYQPRYSFQEYLRTCKRV